MIKCVIVEDQAPAQRLLQGYISDTDGLELKSTFSSPLDAIAYLKGEQIDLIFLDVHLPKISGMEMIKLLDDPPQVILTTAFEKYAIEAFELNATDYLLKPFSYSRFIASIEKVRSKLNTHHPGSGNERIASLFVKDGHDYLNVQIDSILFIKAEGNYTSINKHVDRVLVAYSMKFWENKLPKNQFYRIHKSYLINTGQIKKIARNMVVLSNGSQVPIGRKFKSDFLKEFLD